MPGGHIVTEVSIMKLLRDDRSSTIEVSSKVKMKASHSLNGPEGK